MRHTILALALAVPLAVTGCEKPATMSAADLMAIDAAFSEYSEAHGPAAAWEKYVHEDAVGLNPDQPPTIGRAEMLKAFADWPEHLTLTWDPRGGDVAESGDLGYTWGIYVVMGITPEGEAVKSEGKYATVWKKQPDGSWKAVLDGGSLNGPPAPPPGTEEGAGE
ncbi:MAG TPA: DUF4440 domain-containing protein [Sphingomonadales bacterium]|nr:DUF4440 domain-containing protein [Sphingomonadales bacterium]